MLKGIKPLYFIMVNIVLLLLTAAFVSNRENTATYDMIRLEPDETIAEDEESVNYYFEVLEREVAGEGIAFFTNHHNVTVYCDSVKVYELRAEDGIWGHTTGSVWNFVHIPFGTNDVRIHTQQVYEGYSMPSFFIYAGNDRELYRYILEESLFPMASSAIIILIGVALLVIWYIVKVKTQAVSVSNVFYLGALAVIFGLWTFNETNGATVLFESRVACSFGAFLLLKVLSPTWVLFFREYTNTEEKTFWSILSRLMIIDGVVTVALHMLNVMDLKETLITTHISIIVSFIYSFALIVGAIRKKRITGFVKVHMVASIIILISVVAVFVDYFTGDIGSEVVGHIGFLTFTILAASTTANNAFKMMEKGKYAAIYEELAITDRLTGLYNRNAYQIDSRKIVDLTGVMIVTFDLNDLKECNDTKGHAQGDHYIITAAKMIENLLAPYGYCYRIGGDEFCAIIRNGRACPIEKILMQLEMEQVHYNANITEEQYPIHIAAGYAVYDQEMDEDMEEMRERSDIYMYRNKKKIKEELEERILYSE